MYRNINKQQKTNNYLKQKLLMAQRIMNSNDRYIEEQISKIKNLEKREFILEEKLEDLYPYFFSIFFTSSLLS